MKNQFAERLKEVREKRNLSMAKLAKILGWPPIMISRWERGIHLPGVEHLYLLCEVLGVTPNYLTGWED